MGRFVINPADRHKQQVDSPTAADVFTGQQALGQLMKDGYGNEYMYVHAEADIRRFAAVSVNKGTFRARMLSNIADNLGRPVGVATEAFDDDEYGWIMVRGTTFVETVGTANANARFYTSGTAGKLGTGPSNEDTVVKLTAAANQTTQRPSPTESAVQVNSVLLYRPFISAIG